MNKRLPLGLLAILLIVLLAGIGVAYGLWAETLTVFGTVETGEVDVEFADVETREKVFVTGTGLIDEPLLPIDKSGAAGCEANIGEAGTDWEFLEVTVEGAYPSWHCIVDFKVKSTGSVPVHVYAPSTIMPLQFGVPPAIPPDNPNWAVPECEVGVDGWIQLHQNDTVDCQLVIHFTNDSLVGGVKVGENQTYDFKYYIEARQWNEPLP